MSSGQLMILQAVAELQSQQITPINNRAITPFVYGKGHPSSCWWTVDVHLGNLRKRGLVKREGKSGIAHWSLTAKGKSLLASQPA